MRLVKKLNGFEKRHLALSIKQILNMTNIIECVPCACIATFFEVTSYIS